MENRGKSGSKRRTTRWSRRGTSMESFIFHPTGPSLYHSFSADSETISSFCFDPNPYPSSNSSILSGLLNQEDGSIAPNSSSQTLSCGSGAPFPHPPAWIVEDLSSQAGSHIVPSTAESTNWFGPQENLLDLWNPPILSPVSQNSSISFLNYQDPLILSPVQQVAQPPSGFSRIFLLLIPIIWITSLACRGSVQISHFLLILPTLLQLPFFQVGMSILSCSLLSRGDC